VNITEQNNPYVHVLSASDVNSRHDDISTSDGCSASYREDRQKMVSVFLKEEKTSYKMV